MKKEEQKPEIPKATAKRIPLYFRYLNMLGETGVQRIKSHDLSKLLQTPPATIRRDFSHLGELGRSGYGYDVPYLIEVFGGILDTQVEKKIALVGVGNLGKALIKNNFRRNENLNIVCGFDTDPELIDQTIEGIKIHNILDFKEVTRNMGISAAISTVPSHHAQTAADIVVEAGVTAILNFAPGRITVPASVKVQYIDLTTELQTLIYFDEHYSSSEKGKILARI